MASSFLHQALFVVPRSPVQFPSNKLAFSAAVSRRPCSGGVVSRVPTRSHGFSLSGRGENCSFVVRAEANAEVEVEVEETDENAEGVATEEAEVLSDDKPPTQPRIKLGDIMGVNIRELQVVELYGNGGYSCLDGGCIIVAREWIVVDHFEIFQGVREKGRSFVVVIKQILNKRAIEASDKERPIPDLRTGDIVEIKLEVPENRRRLSIYKGIVISRQNAGIHTTIRIRRVIAGVGVEIVFPIYSPNIKEIKVIKHRKVRRARLYYLRDKLPRLSTFK
ncbi:hypothetical protein DH2020_005432 [Rehmannia glutinosa]|uniref:Uncharacterized protein n=1 Tax=Rehmannia glutinosa TaxID=99300 RepID=A0ABR0XFY8_REHGL